MILVPIGTKAQLIKMAPLILALRKHEVPFDFVLTGQHQETMEDLISGFELPKPAYNLASIVEADTSGKLAAWLIGVLRNHLVSKSQVAERDYCYCLVHGDTVSTLVSAIIARRHRIKVAHVEAGLRSHNWLHPFPEEIIRLMVSRLSSVFYCSGDRAKSNIQRIKANADIVDIGENTLLDSVRFATRDMFRTSFCDGSLPYCVVSIHRFENISNRRRLDFIISTIIKLSYSLNVKFVLHSATKVKLQHTGWLKRLSKEQGIELLPRMRYFEFINLLSRSQFIVTDGGSNQEECSYLGVPCLLMRKKTERSEGLGGTVVLSEYSPQKIQAFLEANIRREVSRNYCCLSSFEEMPSEKIVKDLKQRIMKKTRTP